MFIDVIIQKSLTIWRPSPFSEFDSIVPYVIFRYTVLIVCAGGIRFWLCVTEVCGTHPSLFLLVCRKSVRFSGVLEVGFEKIFTTSVTQVILYSMVVVQPLSHHLTCGTPDVTWWELSPLGGDGGAQLSPLGGDGGEYCFFGELPPLGGVGGECWWELSHLKGEVINVIILFIYRVVSPCRGRGLLPVCVPEVYGSDCVWQRCAAHILLYFYLCAGGL